MFGLSPLPRKFEAAMRDATNKKASVRSSALSDLARYATGPRRDDVIAVLERALGDEDASIRAEAAILLADAGATHSIEPLLEAVQDVDRGVRQMAILALGELAVDPSRDVIETIRTALDDEDAEIRFQALIAWGLLALEAGLDAFLRAAADADAHVRHIALRLIEEHCLKGDAAVLSPEIASRCRRALRDESPAVRLAAAIVLSRSDDAEAREVIVSAILRSDRDVDFEDLQSAIEIAGHRRFQDARLALSRRAFASFGVPRDPFAWHCRVALARLGDIRAKVSILKGLRAWTRDARTLAVAAAGQARLTEARAYIEAMAGDERRADPSAVADALRLLDGDEMEA